MLSSYNSSVAEKTSCPIQPTPASMASLQAQPVVRGGMAQLQKRIFSVEQFHPIINQLAKERFSSIDPLHSSVSWQAARICTLYKTIYQAGVVTERDLPQLNKMQKELAELHKNLAIEALSSTDKAELGKILHEANQAIYATRSLIKSLQQYDRAIHKLNTAIDSCIDRCYSPESPAGALQSACEIKKIFAAFNEFEQFMQKVDKTQPAGKRILALYEDEVHSLKWMVEDWSENFQETATMEFNQLKSALISVENESEAAPLLRQLLALNTQLKWSYQQLSSKKGVSTLFAPLPKLQLAIDQARKTCGLQQKEVAALLSQNNTQRLAPLAYGSGEWLKMAKERPLPKKGLVEKIFEKISQYTEPENWSDTTKKAVFRAFTLMQLSADAIQFSNKLPKEPSKGLQTVPGGVTEQQQAQMDLEYKILKEHLVRDEVFGRLKKGGGKYIGSWERRGGKEFGRALHELFETFPEKPTAQQAEAFLNAFASKRSGLATEAPAPPPRTSTQEEKAEEPPSAQTEELAPLPALRARAWAAQLEPVDKLTALPAARVSGVVPALFQTIGSLFRISSNLSTTPVEAPSGSHFMQQTAINGYTSLKAANAKLQHLQTDTSRLPGSVVDELRGEIALLHRELMKTASETPDETCPMLQLADWFQKVEDKCYAVQVLETRIGSLMEAARQSLSISDEKLRQYGPKHANNEMQRRLAEVMQIPGLMVPISQGVASDDVHAFLRKEAPEIFEHWKKLGELYSAYKEEDQPFLKLSEVQQSLMAIQKGIANAFEKIGQDKEGFKALGLPDIMQSWLAEMKAHDRYLMVRSTGAEDTRQAANAGGNLSKAYVSPEQTPQFQALGEVVQSYFGVSSLQNRINAKANPFEESLKLAVTMQELIGEPIGGAANPKQIPVSVVLFSNEPLYIGNEKFRVMRISATWGHGEGVVGNRGIATDTALLLVSEVCPDRLYILYDNQEKPVRLAPVMTAEGVKLEKLANPPELQRQPALDDVLLKRLYHWGVVGEKFFDDKPTDMEIVIKEGTIYPVQARPVKRRPLLPTFLDLRKLSALSRSPIREQIKGEIIVPGKASAVLCTKPQEVLYAATLEQAEKMYSEGSGVKLVVVSQEEPANSHPVVNFSSLSMPCLYMPDAEQAKKLIESISAAHPLLACVQTATMQTLDKELVEPDTLLSEGFTVHPAKIALSLPTEEKLPQGYTTAQVPQEIKDLLLDIRSALTAEVAAAKLKELRQHGWMQQLKIRKQELQAQMEQLHIVPKTAHKTLRFLEKLENAVEAAFEEAQALLPKYASEKRLQPLFHAKVLEKIILKGAPKHSGVARYTVSEVEPIMEATEAVIEYQKKLPHVAHFADILPAGYQGLTKETDQSWTQFLLELEPLVETGQIPPQQVQQLKQFITTLEKAEALSDWLIFFFPQITSPPPKKWYSLFSLTESKTTPLEKLQRVLNGLPPEQTPFVQDLLDQKGRIQALRGSLEAFGDPKQFKEAWEELLDIRTHLTERSTGYPTFLEQLSQAPPVVRLLAIKTMQDFVELYDGSIKAMKVGTEPREAKAELFKPMLIPELAVLKKWLLETSESGSIPLHANWPLEKYITEMEQILNKQGAGVSQLGPSRGFSVAAAVLGTKTAFERHLPQTLEDMFTLIHQNLIVCTSNLANQLLNSDVVRMSALPDALKSALNQFTPRTFGRAIQRLGFEVKEKEAQVHYNVPLRNHSGKLILAYDNTTGMMTLTGQLLGDARTRWPLFAQVGAFLSDLGLLPFAKATVLGQQELIFTWKIENEEMLKIALEEYVRMAEMSLGWDDPITLINAITAQREIPLDYMKQYLRKMLDPKKQDFSEFEKAVIGAMIDRVKLKHSIDDIRDTLKEAEEYNINGALKVYALFIEKGSMFPEAFNLGRKCLQRAPADIPKEAYDLLSRFVVNGYAFKEGVQAAQMGVPDLSSAAFASAINLLEALVEKGQGMEEALKAAKTLALNPKAAKTLAFNPNASRWTVVKMFSQLVNKGYGIQEVMDTAKAIMPAMSAFFIYGALVEKGYAIEEAIAAAKIGMQVDSDTQNYALRLFQNLVGQDHGIKEAIEAAKRGIQEKNDEAWELYLLLVSRGCGYKEAFQSASEMIYTKQPGWIKRLIRNVIVELLNKGFGIDKLIDVAKAGAGDPKTNDYVDYMESLNLFQQLIERDYGINEAIELAEACVQNPAKKAYGFQLFHMLTNRGHGILEALDAFKKYRLA
jgi:hypothetical protein